LELFGGKLDAYFAVINRRGRHYEEFNGLMTDRGIYRMKIDVRIGDEWVTRNVLYAGGPLISEDTAYVLYIGDVPGEILTIRLVAPATFWMINHLAVDYSEDVQITAKELQPFRAVTHDGRNVKNLITEEDGVYHTMSEADSWTELGFPAPEQDGSSTRTIFVKANGYYDMHVERRGVPRLLTLLWLKFDKDFIIRYAIQRYLEMQRTIRTYSASLSH
jgi:hypothetical protein